MNLLTIIGNAVIDENFRRLLFQDPVGTALQYGFTLTNQDVETLQLLVADTQRGEQLRCNLKDAGDALNALRICPKQPCPFALYAPPQPMGTGQVAAD